MSYLPFTDDEPHRLYRVVSDDCVLELTTDANDLCILTAETSEGFTRLKGLTLTAMLELLEKMYEGDFEVGAGELFHEH